MQDLVARDQFIRNAFSGDKMVQLWLGKPNSLDDAIKLATEIEVVRKLEALNIQSTIARALEEKSRAHTPTQESSALQTVTETLKEV